MIEWGSSNVFIDPRLPDTNVLVRYLGRDDVQQADAARALLEPLTAERPGCICREVMVGLG